MKPFPWKCGTCREREVFQTTLPVYSMEMEHDGRKYTVTLHDFTVFQCRKCQSILLDDAASDRLTDGLRAAAGLLMPAEIEQKRLALHLTRKQVAEALNIAEPTLSRWESGGQIQQRCMDKILRAFFDLKELRGYLQVAEPSFTP